MELQRKKSGKKILQLGKQKKQTISLLKVFSTTLEILEGMVQYAVESEMSLEKIFGHRNIPKRSKMPCQSEAGLLP
jgi:hypothetical protein